MRLEDAFGQVIRRLRLESELSQEALAHAADLSTVYISEIERGRRTPSIRTVVKLADGLRIAPGRLFDPMPDQ